MTRKEKAERIGRILDEKFPLPPIPLDHVDPYTLLVAVVLSAQCTDERVNQVTPKLFARADHPAAMAKLAVPEIRSIILPCGLSPAKSKNIHALSRLLVEKHGGRVPKSFEELEALPGVGHKTASVVMSHAFGVPAFPVDTHIHRLAERWGLSSGRNVAETERDLKAVFPEDEWIRRHLQIIYFGRKYCPARAHDFANCPICSWAASRAHVAREKKARAATPRSAPAGGAARRGRARR
jgi:endonuclease III